VRMRKHPCTLALCADMSKIGLFKRKIEKKSGERISDNRQIRFSGRKQACGTII